MDAADVLELPLVEGDGVAREATADAEREGPSFEATTAERSRKLLYSYFAANLTVKITIVCRNLETHIE